MPLTRRSFLRLAGAGAVGASVAACTGGLLGSLRGAGGGSDGSTDCYEITQREGGTRILPDAATPSGDTTGYSPGLTLHSQRGRRTVVRHHNRLPVPVVVHLHGGVTPPGDDG